MEDLIIKTNHLTKQYGKVKVVDDVSLKLKKGKIYAFIGENGAGKTTLLKMLTGLTYATDGEMQLLGETDQKGYEKARKKIGSIIENPAIYPNYSAKRNLEIQRILCGVPGCEIVDEVMKFMGLEEVGKKKVSNFSLGMKQRLGIGLALINHPKFLILDEPINGLDPRGIAEIRNLLKKLNAEKETTILISSHILSELYLLATDYIFIHKGRIIETLMHEELENRMQKYLMINVDDVNKGVTVIEQHLGTNNFQVHEDGTIFLYDFINDMEHVARKLAEHHVLITRFEVYESSLEDYFFSLIGGVSHE